MHELRGWFLFGDQEIYQHCSKRMSVSIGYMFVTG